MRCLHCLHAEADHETAEYRGDKPRRCLGDKKYREACHCPGFAPEAVPVVVADASDRVRPGATVERHPAYAVVRLSRPTSTGTRLAGSDIEHHTFMEVTVQRASVTRDLHHDWWHAEGSEVVSFRLSASQWAAFVSSQGDGTGTPCTLDHVAGRRVPDILDPPDRMAQVRAELAAAMQAPADKLNALRDLLGAVKMTKADREAVRAGLIHLSNALAPNLTFAVDSATEHLEATRDRVVAEAEAHVAKLIDSVGRGVLAGEGDAIRRALHGATAVPMLARPPEETTP